MTDIDTRLVRRLVDSQFPRWRGLPLRRVDPAGSDHVIHRLGGSLSVRLPRHPGAIGQAVKEATWLPRLAPHLPLRVPVPVAVGRPEFGYPWPWAVARWLPGSVATVADLGASVPAALVLADFLSTLQHLPQPGALGSLPGRPLADHEEAAQETIADLAAQQLAGDDQAMSERLTDSAAQPSADGDEVAPEMIADLAGRPLAERDEVTREAIADLAGVFDADAVTGVWEQALEAPPWSGPPVWFHGDFHTGNLLVVEGRLSAVIDFGGLGVGDPASDLQIAYTLLDPVPRTAFRRALGLDAAAWARGRGWALTGGLLAYRAYADSDRRVAAQTSRQITAALEDAAGENGPAKGRRASAR